MDPLALIWVGIVAALIVAFWLVGRYYPGSGLDQIGQRSAREIVEQREALEADDLDQMLTAYNTRRRARGEAELTIQIWSSRWPRTSAISSDASRVIWPIRRSTSSWRSPTPAGSRSPERTREDVQREFGPLSSDA